MNEVLVRTILTLIDQFERDELDVHDLQQAIESNSSAMEGVPAELSYQLRALDADLEHIQHGMRLEDQRGAVLQRLRELRRRLTDVTE